MKKRKRFNKPALHSLDHFLWDGCGYCGSHAGLDGGEQRGWPACLSCGGV